MKAWEFRKIPLTERIAMNTVIDASTGCHNYTLSLNGGGYPQVRDGGGKMLLHRWVYMQKHGDIGNLHVLHKCDNPSCINIDHLFLGTHTDNMQDKAKKMRGNPPRGYAHKRPMAKLTNEKVVEIKALLKRGYRQADICRDFSVSRAIVSDIALGKTWRHIP